MLGIILKLCIHYLFLSFKIMILQELQQWKNRKNDVAAASIRHAENINCNINHNIHIQVGYST